MKIRRTCQDVTHLLLQSQEQPLRPLEALSLRLHWLACGSCLRFRDQHRLMQQALGRWRSQYASGAADNDKTENR